MSRLSADLKNFIATTPWTFAVTYAKTWPHEYLVRDNFQVEDKKIYFKIVEHIRTFAYEGRFYRRPVWYFEEDGHTYWTMAIKKDGKWDYPVEDTVVINRCRNEQTYEARLKNGTLPEN